MTTGKLMSSWWTNKQTQRTTGCWPWLPDLDYPSGNVAPKRKSIGTDEEKANTRSDHADLKWRNPSVNLWSIQLVFPSVHSLDQALSSLVQVHSAHFGSSKKNPQLLVWYEKEGGGAPLPNQKKKKKKPNKKTKTKTEAKQNKTNKQTNKKEKEKRKKNQLKYRISVLFVRWLSW